MGSQAIAKQLMQWITSGRAAVGSPLPPTRDLASQFGVSLHTVGVALRQLEMQKLVECRPRQRAVVRSRIPARSTEPQLKQIVLYVTNIHEWAVATHGGGSGGEWGARISQHVERELFEAGFSVTVMSRFSEEGPSLSQRLDRLGRTLHGAVCFAGPSNVEIIEEMDRRDVPWVAINRPSRRIDCNYVTADNLSAGWSVGRVFAASGFQRLLLLAASPANSFSESEKITGVFQAYVESGLPTENIRVECARSIQEMSGYQTVRAVLESGFRPQGIFGTGDLLAAGAVHALNDAGLRVPEDVGVIGATGLDLSAQLTPPLSVVAQPMQEIGRTAGKMLLQMIREGTRRYSPRRIPCPVILRESMKLSEMARRQLLEHVQFEDHSPAAAHPIPKENIAEAASAAQWIHQPSAAQAVAMTCQTDEGRSS